jgi:hypothetical protein
MAPAIKTHPTTGQLKILQLRLAYLFVVSCYCTHWSFVRISIVYSFIYSYMSYYLLNFSSGIQSLHFRNKIHPRTLPQCLHKVSRYCKMLRIQEYSFSRIFFDSLKINI